MLQPAQILVAPCIPGLFKWVRDEEPGDQHLSGPDAQTGDQALEEDAAKEQFLGQRHSGHKQRGVEQGVEGGVCEIKTHQARDGEH